MVTTKLCRSSGVLLATLILAGGCSKPKTAADHPTPTNVPLGLNDTASLVWVMGGELEAFGGPQIFDITVTLSSGAAPIHKGGDLPAPGQTVKIDGLPSDAAATISGSLYKTHVHPSDKTHSCFADQPVALVAGQASSVTLSCITTVEPTAQPIKVLLKMAQLTLNFAELDATQILAARDFTQPSLFAVIDSKGRRITLKQDVASLTVHVGGDVSYRVMNDPAQPLPLIQLLSGASLSLTAVAGQNLQALSESATLKLAAAPLLYEPNIGDIAAVLPISLVNTVGTLSVEGRLFEEPADREITVVSYNVENLFDQVDEDRNSTYGDYRIAANGAGQSSNYGDPVLLDGQTMSFTDVKIAGIKKVLIGLDPAGPEIVGLVEVESKAAVDALLAATQDLGYKAAVFSEWTADMTPTAIGMGLITKLPVLDQGVLKVATPALTGAEPSRPILKVTLDVAGQPLIVYVNHWKSKGGPESQRILYAEAIEADIAQMQSTKPKVDYIIMGDMNSEYNEKVVIETAHNDANGMTGLNDTLHAQGDELLVLKNLNPLLKYNLQYELNKSARRTAWHMGFEWSALDNMIIGSGMYDQRGITYIDGSFQPVTATMPSLSFLFKADGTTNRWHQFREAGGRTRHEVGGYSDHLPIFARFRVPVRQTDGTIWLGVAGKPDGTDSPTP